MMNRVGIFLAVLWLLCAASWPALAAPGVQMHSNPDGEYSSVANAFEGYRLGSGDKIKIHVFGEKDMDVEVRLGASGDLRYPFLGKIHVEGMTMPELEKKITGELSGRYLVDPQVRVSMEEFRPFYVNGKVQKPGGYPYQPGLTVRKAISLAGGFSEDADEHKVFLIRAVDSQRHASKVALNRQISPGDIIMVKQSYFFVNGEVEKPGKFSFQQDMTYRMAISMAGGLKERADDGKIYVVHEKTNGESMHVDNLDRPIQPGDVITVKKSFF